ncbi:ABC-type transporter ATP-binding protein EcsA [compost metagenome]
MLIVRNVSKRYENTEAVKQVSFHVAPGEVAILLGPNGAGKSTTIKCVVGLLKHEGHVQIGGHASTSLEAKQICSYVPETPALYDMLTVYEHMEFIAHAYKIIDYKVKIEDLLERFDLSDKQNKLGKELSKGMQQKVSLCCGLLTQPKLIFFDEPMIGLDPKAIKELKKVISELKERGSSVVISTHIIESIDDLWDKALIMKEGRVLVQTTRASLESSGECLEDVFFEVTEA